MFASLGCAGQRIDAEAVGRELAHAVGRVRQRRQGVERPLVLRGRIAGAARVELVEVEPQPPRSTCRPSPERSHAKPTRGEMSFRGVVGTPVYAVLPMAQQDLARRVVRDVVLVVEVEIDVVANADVQRQPRGGAPVVLEPRRELFGAVVDVLRADRVGLLPLPHDARASESPADSVRCCC